MLQTDILHLSDTEKLKQPKRGSYSFKDVPLNNPLVWNVFQRGDVKGIFQVESNLGRQWCKNIKPSNIDELAALNSLVRPGGLESLMCEKYANIKNGLEEPTYIHPSLEPILKNTYSCLVFQEQILEICVKLAGFTEIEADLARRSIGKKLPEEMMKVEKMFLEGCKKQGIVDEATAKEIFGWIQKSVRYLFNACVTEDTVVFTDKQEYKALAELQIGEKILAPNNKYVSVVNKFNNGIKHVYKITLSSGKTIKSTLDHEYLCSNNKKHKLSEVLEQDLEIYCRLDTGKLEYNFEKVIQIMYLGQLLTVDIEVDDPEHVYYGNGIAISNSHAYSYTYVSYFQAYQKYYFPTEFYAAALTYANEKMDPKEEIFELVQDARLHDIKVLPPNIKRKNIDFEIIKDKEIVFGLSHIRSVGNSAIENLKKINIDTFIDFLINVKILKRNVAESLIKSGACDCYNIDRAAMLRQVHLIYGRNEKDSDDISAENKALTPKEYKYFILKLEETRDIKIALQSLVADKICTAKRAPTIEKKIGALLNLPSSSARYRSVWEKLYLGISLTCSAADDVQKIEDNVYLCKEIYKLPNRKKVVLHVVVDKIDRRRTSEKSKNPNQPYAYITVSDNSVSVQAVMWPEVYEKYKDELTEGMVICLYGQRDNWKGKDQVVINNIAIIG